MTLRRNDNISSIVQPIPQNLVIPEFTKTTENISTESPKDKDDKKVKEEKISLPQNWVEKFFDNIFKSIAMLGGEHWKLTDEEKKDLAVSGKPVIEKYLPYIIRYMLEANFLLAVIRIVGTKAKIQWDLRKAQQQEQGQKQLENFINQEVDKRIGDRGKPKQEEEFLSHSEKKNLAKKLEIAEEDKLFLEKENDKLKKKLIEQELREDENEDKEIEDNDIETDTDYKIN